MPTLGRGAGRGAISSGRRHRLDPDDVDAALLQALDLLDEHVDRLVLAHRPERREQIAGRPDRAGDDDPTAAPRRRPRGHSRPPPIEFARAPLEIVERQTSPVAAKTIGENDVGAGVDELLVQRPDAIGMGRRSTVQGCRPRSGPTSKRLVPVAPSASSVRPLARSFCSIPVLVPARRAPGAR